ncbi:hypothetical protein Rsub_00037 [Raphidocelis subcapitata]|uniref:Uncharacterized protein n=1 Tax=Raphidocelis subcapitata TaxID=307507 RepID=A0A2V0NJE2_9CHLO|nr:hypothetical protein Rsub_00037 [Raphidocelis subcapitata]|eukprot:GBF87326.1 hypothetical protein Rsub_00037 [Raphidocelis subcapitata]
MLRCCMGRGARDPASPQQEVFGGPSCRRLSLDPYAAARATAAAAAQRSPTAQLLRRLSGGSAGGGGCGGAPNSPPPPNPEYIEFNPLRRNSLPTWGQAPRPTNALRRGSLPWAPSAVPLAAQ